MARRRGFFPTNGPGTLQGPSSGVARRSLGSGGLSQPSPQQGPPELPPPVDLQGAIRSPIPEGPFADRGPTTPENIGFLTQPNQQSDQQSGMLGDDTQAMILRLLKGMGRV